MQTQGKKVRLKFNTQNRKLQSFTSSAFCNNLLVVQQAKFIPKLEQKDFWMSHDIYFHDHMIIFFT